MEKCRSCPCTNFEKHPFLLNACKQCLHDHTGEPEATEKPTSDQSSIPTNPVPELKAVPLRDFARPTSSVSSNQRSATSIQPPALPTRPSGGSLRGPSPATSSENVPTRKGEQSKTESGKIEIKCFFKPTCKRDYIINEVVSSEETYVANLGQVIDTFLVPLASGAHHPLVSGGPSSESPRQTTVPPSPTSSAPSSASPPIPTTPSSTTPQRSNSTASTPPASPHNTTGAPPQAAGGVRASAFSLIAASGEWIPFLGWNSKETKTEEPQLRLLPDNEIPTIFSNIREIYLLNKAFLDDLKKRVVDWDSTTSRIADIFLQFTPYLRTYLVYASNHDIGQARFATLLDTIPAFKEYVREWETAPSISPHNLSSFLILPIQRVPRYELLLRDLVKATEETHPDYQNLNIALKSIREINQLINTSIADAKNRLHMIDIQRSFIGWHTPDLVAPHRTWIKQGTVTKISRSKHEERMLFLFNDILIVASASVASTITAAPKYYLHHLFNLSTLRIDDMPDTEMATKVVQNAFKIVSPNKSFVVYTTTLKDKLEWMRVLDLTITQWNEKRTALLQQQKHQQDVPSIVIEAPIWIPDSEVTGCMMCQALFSMTRRRHHCRSCGRVVCASCSSGRHKLTNLSSSSLARVCDKCHASLQRSNTQGSQDVTVVGLYDYDGKTKYEHSFFAGDKFSLVGGEEAIDGWLFCIAIKNGSYGFVPANYVQKIM